MFRRGLLAGLRLSLGPLPASESRLTLQTALRFCLSSRRRKRGSSCSGGGCWPWQCLEDTSANKAATDTWWLRCMIPHTLSQGWTNKGSSWTCGTTASLQKSRKSFTKTCQQGALRGASSTQKLFSTSTVRFHKSPCRNRCAACQALKITLKAKAPPQTYKYAMIPMTHEGNVSVLPEAPDCPQMFTAVPGKGISNPGLPRMQKSLLGCCAVETRHPSASDFSGDNEAQGMLGFLGLPCYRAPACLPPSSSDMLVPGCRSWSPLEA